MFVVETGLRHSLQSAVFWLMSDFLHPKYDLTTQISPHLCINSSSLCPGLVWLGLWLVLSRINGGNCLFLAPPCLFVVTPDSVQRT